MEKWQCSCGKENDGKFCTKCGNKRPDSLRTDDTIQMNPQEWICSCGTRNTKNFCVNCGASRTGSSSTNPANPANPIGEESKQGKQQRPVVYALIAVILILCGVVAFFAFKHSQNHEEQPVAPTQATTANKKPIREISNELSLGNIVLGDSIATVHEFLGKETRQEAKPGGVVFYIFEGLQVGSRDSKIVTTLVSDGPEAETKRGIHEGCTYQQMADAYGKNYQKMEYNDLDLYEYSFTAPDGEPGILRFALNKADSKVNYISVRLQNDAPPVKVGEAVNPNPNNNRLALQSFLGYHQAITQRNLRTAYDYYDTDLKNQVSYESWAPGYQNTLSSTVGNARVTYADDSQAKISYQLRARDREGNRIKVQIFNGVTTMVMQNGRWLIHDMAADKIREYYE